MGKNRDQNWFDDDDDDDEGRLGGLVVSAQDSRSHGRGLSLSSCWPNIDTVLA